MFKEDPYKRIVFHPCSLVIVNRLTLSKWSLNMVTLKWIATLSSFHSTDLVFLSGSEMYLWPWHLSCYYNVQVCEEDKFPTQNCGAIFTFLRKLQGLKGWKKYMYDDSFLNFVFCFQLLSGVYGVRKSRSLMTLEI